MRLYTHRHLRQCCASRVYQSCDCQSVAGHPAQRDVLCRASHGSRHASDSRAGLGDLHLAAGSLVVLHLTAQRTYGVRPRLVQSHMVFDDFPQRRLHARHHLDRARTRQQRHYVGRFCHDHLPRGHIPLYPRHARASTVPRRRHVARSGRGQGDMISDITMPLRAYAWSS